MRSGAQGLRFGVQGLVLIEGLGLGLGGLGLKVEGLTFSSLRVKCLQGCQFSV